MSVDADRPAKCRLEKNCWSVKQAIPSFPNIQGLSEETTQS